MLVLFLEYFDTEEEKNEFIKVYDEFKGLLFKIANDKLFDKSYANDFIQDVFIELIHSFEKFLSIDNEYAKKRYIVVIAERCAYRFNYKEAIKEKLEIPLESVSEALEDTNDYSWANSINLKKALGELDEKYRLPVVMKYVYGYKISEISEVLLISENTTKQRIHRGIMMLKTAFE